MRARSHVTAAAFTPVTPAEPVPGDAAGREMLGSAGEVLVRRGRRLGGRQEPVQRGSCKLGTGRASSSAILSISHGSGAPSP